MITSTGIVCDPGGDSSPNEADIAIAMCRITRYAGALWVPLAAHSILVAEYAYQAAAESAAESADRNVLFALGLLHDAHETITGESTRAWKAPEMKPREEELDRRIFKYFNLDVLRLRTASCPGGIVKVADEKALAAEATLREYPGWEQYYERKNGRKPPELTEDERIAAGVVLEIWTKPSMIERNSAHMFAFCDALKCVRAGDYAQARRILVIPTKESTVCGGGRA